MDKVTMEKRMRRFGIAVARMCRKKGLRHPVDEVLVKQLVRCATSVCANYRAACHGKSRADFHAKIKICEEESDECEYWLDLVVEMGLFAAEEVAPLRTEAHELASILSASARSSAK